jgi:diphthamide synthase (EF-2-diphthine--ammonia ligase)
MGLEGVFHFVPTYDLIQEFIALGFKTIVVCVNERYLDKSFIGRVIDQNFINDLPENVDVCGENGEFHTFTFDGPIFSKPIDFEIGEMRKYENQRGSNTVCESDATDVFDYGFWYCDLVEK